MGGEWRVASLGESGVTLIDCDHRTPPAAATGYPYVAIPQLKAGRIDLADVRRISAEHFVEWTRKARPQPFDVVLSRRCNPGETAFVTPDLKFALGQNLVLLRSNGTRILPEFLRWLVRGPQWWEQVQKFLNVGAVFDSLRCADVPKFELLIPPLTTQRAIARILGALDDKIELNRKMNTTLEAMALAIFKSWFVDFDPVRAKAEGWRPSGMEAETAKVFPSEFVKSELGDIPKGWSVASIGDLAEIVGGSTPSTKEPGYWDEGVHHWATPKDLSPLTTPVIATTERKITDEGLRQISSGLLPVGTVLLSSRAPIGYLGIAEVPLAVNQGFIAMKPKARVPSQFLLRWAEAAHDEIVSRANGSTFLEISKSNFRPIPLVRPSDAALAAYDKLADGFYRQVVVNERNSRSLARLRDELLPCLLSGELSVAGADREVEAVA